MRWGQRRRVVPQVRSRVHAYDTNGAAAPFVPQAVPAGAGGGYFLADAADADLRAAARPVPRPSPIFLANSERCSAYFGATIG
jgi:hypothetical protein